MIILTGMKHCGKSTQGSLLASFYGFPFFDTDTLIENNTGKSARQIYTESGKEGFMAAEEEACILLVRNIGPGSAVIATGGGICCNDKALAVLKPLGVFVYLKADEKISADRIVNKIRVLDDGSMTGVPAYIAKENPHSLEDVRAYFHNFYLERTALYGSLADITVQMLPVKKEENLNRITSALKASGF